MFAISLESAFYSAFASALTDSVPAALAAEVPGEPAVRDNNAFNENSLSANDDGSTQAVQFGFNANFFGTIYSQLFVNNNGNVTFDHALVTYTPFTLVQSNRVIIAPFFADVDTRGIGAVTYGQDTVDGHAAFGVNWAGVGYYSQKTDKVNTFQLVLIDRSDIAPGDFDFEFNYEAVAWETGDASDGTGGLGGSSARAGYSNGTNQFFELLGSDIDGGFLDGNSDTGLIHHSRLSILAGRYRFEVRNGEVDNDSAPLALDDIAIIAPGASTIINVIHNDSDPDGVVIPGSVTIVNQPLYGAVAVDPVTGAITYTPGSDSTGEDGSPIQSDQFTYFVRDDDGFVSNVATVEIQFNLPPIDESPSIVPVVPNVPLRPDASDVEAPSAERLLVIRTFLQPRATPNNAGYGTNGYLSTDQGFSVQPLTPQAIDLAIGNDKLDESFLLANFLDFVDPEMLVVDLGDEPPAQLESANPKTAAEPAKAASEESAESKSVPATESQGSVTNGAVSYMKPPTAELLPAAPIEGASTPVSTLFTKNWKWIASTAGTILIAGAAWKSRDAWLQAARRLRSR
jgi:hypothetical protein